MTAFRLTTAEAVIDVLGGFEAVATLTGRKYTAVWNWKKFDAFPPNTFVVMTEALRQAGLAAPASLWGMTEPASVGSATRTFPNPVGAD